MIVLGDCGCIGASRLVVIAARASIMALLGKKGCNVSKSRRKVKTSESHLLLGFLDAIAQASKQVHELVAQGLRRL
eukprot:1160068-Pelagomonas_calceolata.AAC.9